MHISTSFIRTHYTFSNPTALHFENYQYLPPFYHTPVAHYLIGVSFLWYLTLTLTSNLWYTGSRIPST